MKVGDISKIEPNIHAGVKYMRFMMDQYFKDDPMDPLNKGLMTFASYNAGPGRVRQLRREAEKRGLDPNVWFGNVERSRPSVSGAKRSPTSATSTSTTSHTGFSTIRCERRAAAKAALTTSQVARRSPHDIR